MEHMNFRNVLNHAVFENKEDVGEWVPEVGFNLIQLAVVIIALEIIF